MRYKLFILIMALLDSGVQAQSEMSSEYTLLYKLDSATVQAYYHHRSVFRLIKDARDGSSPDTCMAEISGSCQLPHAPGAYLLVWTEQSDLKWKLAYRHSMSLDLRQDGNKVLIKLFDRYSSLIIKDAVIYYGDKPYYFDEELEGYLLKKGSFLNKFQDSYLIHRNKNVVIAHIDTYSYGFRRWSRFWYSIPYYIANPFRRNEKYDGYLALNKPGLFRVGDTLKYKAAVLKANGKPLKKKKLLLVMSSYDRQNGYQEFEIPNVDYYAPGRIKGYFVIADSLEGKNVSIFIADRINKYDSYRRKYFTKSLQIHEYILDEIEFESELINDDGYITRAIPLKIKLEARDQNDLPILDGQVHITLSPQNVHQYNDESIAIIRDPLLDSTFALNPGGENIFKFYPENWPMANLLIQCQVKLSNSSHETHAEHYRVEYKPHQYPFSAEVKDGTIEFKLIRGGHEMPDSILLIGLQQPRYSHRRRHFSESDTILSREIIKVPYSKTWDPAVDEYQVYADGELIKEMYNDLDRHPRQILGFEADSVLISFMHADIMPVLYEVYVNGRKLVSTGTCRGDTIRVSREAGDYLVLKYHLLGESDAYTEVIPLADIIRSKIVPLQAEVSIPDRIRPGVKKEVELVVTDPKGNPEEGLDILAVAVKSSFDSEPVTELLPRPYYKKRIKRPKDKNYSVEFGSVYGDRFYAWGISRPLYEVLDLSAKKAYQYMFLDEGLRLDTMSLPMNTRYGQFAAFVYDSSSQFEVYAIYANGIPVYRYDMDFPAYSIPLAPGRYTMTLRCRDESLEVDSVMIYPGKKTELALNLARLPVGVRRTKEKNYFTKDEHEKFAPFMVMIYGSIGNYTISQGDNWFTGRGSSYNRYGNFKEGPATFWSFTTDSLRFYLEPGHTYSFSENVVKQVPLNDSYVKTRLRRAIKYQMPGEFMQKKSTGYHYIPRTAIPEFLPENTGNTSTGLLKLYNRSDSIFNYFQLYHYESELMYYGGYNTALINSFPSGYYRLQAYTAHKHSVVIDSFRVNEDQTTYLWLQNKHFDKHFNFGNLKTSDIDLQSESDLGIENNSLTAEFAGKSLILGTVQEAGSLESIPFANVLVKSAAGYIITGGTTDMDGSVIIRDVLPGTYTLEISFTGYSTFVITHFKVYNTRISTFNVLLEECLNMLTEVVLNYEAPLIDKSKSSSVITSQDIVNMAVRDISSVSAQAAGVAAEDANVRAARTEGTVYFIDGVRVRGSVNIPQAAIAQNRIGAYDLVEDYGYIGPNEEPKQQKASINTSNRFAELMASYSQYEDGYRENFRDYAFFIPDITTDKDGRATFEVEYPDDIAAWKTTLVGLGDDFRYFKKDYYTKSFLEVVPRLYVPAFLREGDSCLVIGKTLNYLDTSLTVTTMAEVNGFRVLDTTRTLNTRFIDEIPVLAGLDPLDVTYRMSLGNDVNTGEKRVIASEQRGVELYEGAFIRIDKDTSFIYDNTGNQIVEMTAMLGSGDILVHLADQLDRYPYECNEQLASKLKALVSLEIYQEQRGAKFREQKKIQRLLSELSQSQNSDGGWGWWSGQESDPLISGYVQEALYYAEKNDYGFNGRINIRSYLESLLFHLPVHKRIPSLYVLSEGKKELAYEYFLQSLNTDSLSISDLIKHAIICERNNLKYDTAGVEALLQSDMLGGTFVERDHAFSWNSRISNSFLMAQYLEIAGSGKQLNKLIDHLLMSKKLQSLNTIELSSAIRLLLMDSVRSFKGGGLVSVNGKVHDLEAQSISQWENDSSILNIQVESENPIYLGLARKVYREQISVDSSRFRISSSWETPGDKTGRITAGDQVLLNLDVKAMSDAEYVMVQIPVPAGFNLDKTSFSDLRGAYLENRSTHVHLYFRHLRAGSNKLTLKFNPRFKGEFHLPPVKAELMYFTVMNGFGDPGKIEVN